MQRTLRVVPIGLTALAWAFLAFQAGARSLTPAAGEPVARQAASASDAARMAWWREARFGLFIHWGLYAVPAGEWNGRTDYGEWIRHNARIPIDVYDRFRAQFNPAKFDAVRWVRLARQAGMKYIVITSKHHDGFALWDSKASEFDVMATPFGRDILKELAEACRREGMRLGFYHSIMDWHHSDYLPRRDWEEGSRPAAGASFERYVGYMKQQLRELLTGYGPIAVLWFDGQWEGTWTNTRGRDLYDYVRSLQPPVVINNRVGRAGGDFGISLGQGRIGDFGTPEQQVPATGLPGLDWESCITMNRNWGYNRADNDYKSPEQLVRMLADIASKGGNLLLNVGPTSDGEFPPESVERLEAVGKWMAVNGEAIHGTTAGPFPMLSWGRATQKPGPGGTTRLYLHVFDWPADGRLLVPGLLSEPAGAWLLADTARRPLPVTRDGDALVIAAPASAPDPIDTVVVLDVTGRPDVAVAPLIQSDADIFVGQTDVQITTDRPNVELRFTTDGSEPGPQSPLVPGPVRLTGSATVRARAFRSGRPVSPVAGASFTRVEPMAPMRAFAPEPGLDFDYVEGEFSKLPDFDATASVRHGTVRGFDLSPRARPSRFAFRFRGVIDIPRTGVYRFYVLSDDGSRLWIGDQLVVENDGLHSAHEESGAVALGAGRHSIVVAMFEATGGFELGVSYSGPDLPKQPIPATVLGRLPR